PHAAKALRAPEIATVERRRRAPLARGQGRLVWCPAYRVKSAFTRVLDALWHAHRMRTRHPGACRRSAIPLDRGTRGNDATRPRNEAGEMRKEKWSGEVENRKRESEE